VPFGDEAGFFERVDMLLDDPALRRRMGRAAREFATTLSWEAILDGLMDIHSRLPDGRGGPAKISTGS
jgi:glycosyltransferase involved in cell wall biosynthesis